MYGPPWRHTAPAWALDGQRYGLVVPDTVRFTRALQVAEHNPVVGAVNIALAVTAPTDTVRLMGRLLDIEGPRLTRHVIDRVADDLTMEVTGWRRWTLQRLWDQTFDAWPLIGGRLIAAGVDIADLSVGDASAALYSTWAHLYSQAPEAWKKMSDALHRAPPRHLQRTIEESSEEDVEADFEAVQSFAAVQGGEATPPVADSQIVLPGSSTLNST